MKCPKLEENDSVEDLELEIYEIMKYRTSVSELFRYIHVF